ncbi:hypothetical protein A2565_02300 [Candidatus Nomurabacteria bacterium RIFOXYD1_FULL_36_19]|nr:MAG: hypothetical protein A2565_02300 [Candidatus Nomurabacteria bacterium RIFOXYD1_FULL_36_19]
MKSRPTARDWWSLSLREQYTFSFRLIPKNEKLFASLTQAKQLACYPAQYEKTPLEGVFSYCAG